MELPAIAHYKVMIVFQEYSTGERCMGETGPLRNQGGA